MSDSKKKTSSKKAPVKKAVAKKKAPAKKAPAKKAAAPKKKSVKPAVEAAVIHEALHELETIKIKPLQNNECYFPRDNCQYF